MGSTAELYRTGGPSPSIVFLMELIRGYVSDRPWGQTLGALGVRHASGQLTLQSDDGKQYCIAFDNGQIVGATSPLAADSAARVAITNHLITSGHLQAISRATVAHPELDELDLVIQTCNLELDLAVKLRQKVLAQRAARTFAVTSGAFTVDDQRTIPASSTGAVDIRAVVYMGARLHLDEQRLATELKLLGNYFTLTREADRQLVEYGLEGHEMPILEELRTGTTLPELEAKYREIDPRNVQALIYALVSCFTVDVGHGAAIAAGTHPPLGVARETRVPTRTSSNPPFRTGNPTVPPFPRTTTNRPATIPPSSQTVTNPTAPEPPRTTTLPPRTTTPPPMAARTATRPYQDEAIAVRPRTQTPKSSDRPVTFVAARSVDASRTVSRTTTPPTVSRTQSGRGASAPPVTARTQTGPTPDEFAPRGSDPLRTAAEAYKRGQDALRVDAIPQAILELSRATELNPHEFDYHAMLAWAQFCGASDRNKLAEKTRKMLGHAIQKSRQPELPRLCLGRMERMLGRDKEALAHFQQITDVDPSHAEAAEEIRALQTKLASGSAEKPGLAGLFSRKKPTNSP